MSWIILTFISVISRAIYGVMTKVMSNGIKVSAYTQAFLLMFTCGLLALMVAPFAGGVSFSLDGVNAIAVALLIGGSVLGNILYFAAMKYLTSGTAQITFSSILIFNTFLAIIFTQLSLNLVNILGVIILMIAVLSVTSGKIELNKRGVGLMLAAAFCFAVFQLSSGVVSKQMSVINYLLIAYLGSAFVILLLKLKVIYNDIKNTKDYSTYKIILLTALPSLGNFVFAYFAYRAAPEPAKVAILLTSQVVIAVIISYFLLHEKQHIARKIFAGLLVIVSAILIKM